ncbi:hypothetical protein Hanom_Chr03g00183611 [Helianthus anomalus]
MQLISVIHHRYIGYPSLCKISVSNIGTDTIGDIDRYITDFPNISPVFPISVPFFLVLPFIFLLIAVIIVLSDFC